MIVQPVLSNMSLSIHPIVVQIFEDNVPQLFYNSSCITES